MKLWAKIFLAIGLGIATGFILGPKASFLHPVGALFLQLLSCLIVPLVFSSMVVGISSLSETKQLGSIGGKTLLLYAISTLIAIALGTALCTFMPIGKTLHLQTATQVLDVPTHTITDLILSIVPKNPIKAFAEQNVLQIIVFSVLLGIAITLSGSKGKPLLNFLESLSSVMQRMTHFIMEASPIGVFALMAEASGSFGLDMLVPVMKFLLLYYVACLLFAIICFCGLLYFGAKLHPWRFFQGMKETIATAISTCSSSACLPISIECVTNRLGVQPKIANFVLPLGCSLNMSGSALFQLMSALFLAHAYGIDLSIQSFVTLSFTVFFASVGTAHIPGAGFIALSVVLSSIGVPLEGLAILAGIDRLRDMASTTLNILGDAVCTVYVAKKTDNLDIRAYESSHVSLEKT